MSAAIIADNTTTKVSTMPRGSVTTNGSTQILFTTPANSRYRISFLMFSVDPSNRHLDLFDSNGSPTILQRLVNNIATTVYKFDPPIELSSGQGLQLNGNAIGLYTSNWAAVGEHLINTP